MEKEACKLPEETALEHQQRFQQQTSEHWQRFWQPLPFPLLKSNCQ
jgi:hypothetical protein